LKPESGQFTRRHEISIAGVAGIDEDVRDHPIPTRSKEFFSHAHADDHNGKVMHSQISEEQAKEHAKKVAYNKQTALIMDEVQQIEKRDDNLDVGETFLMHVPVWELNYSYGGGTYKASVAAATGYVIESKYPRSLAFRAAGIGFGLILLIAGIGLIGLSVVLSILPPGISVTGGILTILSFLLLYKGVSRKEAKEEL
jgi:hypothetical protein